MKCPRCKDLELKATKLEDGLPVHGCESCGGSIVSLLYYRDWAERTINNHVETQNPNIEIHEESDAQEALTCPKCTRLMTKYSISGLIKNRVDLCASCDEAWIDGGEWELLKSLKLSKKIPAVFTDAWQRKVRKEVGENKLKERFTKIIGVEDMLKADEIRSWLNGHAKKTEILFYLGKE